MPVAEVDVPTKLAAHCRLLRKVRSLRGSSIEDWGLAKRKVLSGEATLTETETEVFPMRLVPPTVQERPRRTSLDRTLETSTTSGSGQSTEMKDVHSNEKTIIGETI